LALLSECQLDYIRVWEIEPRVVEAVTKLSPPVARVLALPTTTLLMGDARVGLLLDRTQYDIIAVQTSHPWVAGSGLLYTREFFTLLRQRVTSGGVVGQWISLFEMDMTTLNAVVRSFFDVFPYGFAMASFQSGDIAMFGALEPLVFDFARLEDAMTQPLVATTSRRLGLSKAEQWLWYYLFSRDRAMELTRDAPINTDLRVLTEHRGPTTGLVVDGLGDPAVVLHAIRTLDFAAVVPSRDHAAVFAALGEFYTARGWMSGAHRMQVALRSVGHPSKSPR